MRTSVLLLASVIAGFSACTNVDATRRASTLEVQGSLAARTGITPERRADDSDVVIRSAVDELLRDDLTEENAVRIALLNNHDVRSGYERLGVAAADLVRAGLLRNPVFDGEALLGFGGGAEVALGLAKPFVDLFWRPLRQRAAEYELQAVVASLTRELVELTFAVRREFVRVRTAEQLVESQRRSLAAAQAAHELMQTLATAGNVVGAQLSAARLAEARARLDLADAERAAIEVREPLNTLLGLWGRRVAWHVAEDAAPPAVDHVEWEQVEARAIAASLALVENRARIDAAAQRAQIQSWSRWLPDGVVGVSAQRDPSGRETLGPALALELPVFDDGTAAAAAAQSQVRLLVHRHAQIAVEVRARARVLRERIDRIEARVRFVELEYLPAQDRLLHETMQNYNAMQIGAFDVIAQKLRQLDAFREALVASSDARLARLDLEELLAGGQSQGVATPDLSTGKSRSDDGDRGEH
ncbi:MAG: TolC family protein [Planctomycetes bacterium]|nr:TolC family protein [Planctomycetota bacterium]